MRSLTKTTLPALIVIVIGRNDNPPRRILIFAIGLRGRTSKLVAGGDEVDTVNVLNELDDITTHTALPAIPDAFFRIDRETVVAAANRARPDPLYLVATQLDAALIDY